MARLSHAFRRSWLPLSIVGVLLSLIGLVAPGQGAALPDADDRPAASAPGVQQLLVSDSRQINFVLQVPTFEIDDAGELQAAGLNSVTTVAGAPALPYYSTLIALPPEANAHVQVYVEGLTYDTLARPPRPAARAATDAPLPEDTTAWPAQLAVEYEPAPEYYESGTSFPEERYRLSEPKYYRDVRYVQLDLFPLQYRPEGQRLAHAHTLHVSVQFVGGQTASRRPAGGDDAHLEPLAAQMLNPEQMTAWRSLPASLEAPETKLPVGKEVYKIEVAADGIYAVTGAALQAAGMNLASVDPDTLEMLYRGEPVAYEFRDEAGDDTFDVEDAVYFYGWAFDGPRTERQFITNNVFWLWAGGSRQTIEDARTLAAPAEEIATSFRDTITREEEQIYMHTRTNRWDEFPNEPDSWYWEILTKTSNVPAMTVSHEIALPDPATSGAPAQLTFEYLSSHSPSTQIHTATVHLNNANGHGGSLSWFGLQNVNVTATVPVTALLAGPNQAVTTFTTANSSTTRYYLNRITVEYQRLFRAVGDQLIFTDEAAPHSYEVAGYSEGDPEEILIWDISERRQPRRVPLTAITGGDPYTYAFSTDRSGSATFIATTDARVEEPPAIEQYVVPDLNPADGADWVAITHPLFTAEANRLAAHRQQTVYGGLQTHVVEIEDVINQYGYGLPLPAAIHDYLAHALASWQRAPAYVLLVGDATVNPRGIACDQHVKLGDCDFWGEENDPNLVLTDIIFVDRFQGTVISDHTFVLLSGEDLIPDMALGRLAVQSAQEAKNVIDKIIRYEASYLTPQPWHDNVLFLSDDADGGGAFCPANYGVQAYLPANSNQIHLCLEPTGADHLDITPTLVTSDVQEIRVAMSEWVNAEGVSILNYRGHGGVQFWGGNPTFMSSSDQGWWNNYDRPPVILSLDCLDGFFAYPGYPALSETFLALERVGSVAHWSSTGLGLTTEHSVFQKHFYAGLYEHELDVIGDTIVYAKTMYDMSVADNSELYSFTLQGDPAMRLFGADVQQIYLPQLTR